MGRFDDLRLSKLLGQADPQWVAAFATALKQALEQPDVRSTLERRGLWADVQGIFDIPLTYEGLKRQTEQRQEAERAGTDIPGRIETAFAGLLTRPVARRLGKGAASYLSNFGIGERPTPLPEDVMFGQTDPLQLAGEIGTGLASTVLATRGIGALPGMASLGGAATPATFALTGGGLEAGMELGRGEPLSPLKIGTEAAIFGTGGIPLRTAGALTNRALAAALTGGAAAIAAQVPGTDVRPERVVTEMLFAGLFGNPVSPVARARTYTAAAPYQPPVVPSAGPLKERILSLLPGTEFMNRDQIAATLGAPKHIVSGRLSELVKAGRLVADTTKKPWTYTTPIQAQLRQAAQTADSASAAQVYTLREAIARELSVHPDDVLRQIESMGGLDAVLARDASVLRNGQLLLDIDAPLTNPLRPKPDPKFESAPVLAGAQVVAWKAGLNNKHEMFVLDTLLKRYVSKPSKNFPGGKGFVSTGVEKAELLDALAELSGSDRLQFSEKLRQIVGNWGEGEGVKPKDSIPELDALIETAQKTVIEARRVDFNTSLERATRRVMESEIDALRKADPERAGNLAAKLNELATEGVQFLEHGPDTRRQILGELISDKTPRELDTWQKALPAQLEPYREELASLIKDRLKNADSVYKDARRLNTIIREMPGVATEDAVNAIRKITDINDARAIALKLQLGLHELKDTSGNFVGYSLNLRGRGTSTKFLKSVAGLRYYLQNIAEGKVTDLESLHAVAANKMYDVKHMGNGEFIARSPIPGDPTIQGTFQEVSQAIEARPSPAVQDLGGADLIYVEGVGGMGDLLKPYVNPDTVQPPQRWHRDIWGSAGRLLDVYQEYLGMPVRDHWKLLEDANRLRRKFEQPFLDQLRKSWKGIWPSRAPAVMDYMIAGNARGEPQFQLSKKEQAVADSTMDTINRFMGWSKEDGDAFLSEGVSAIRAVDGDFSRLSTDYRMPYQFQDIWQDISNGHVRLDVDNPFAMAHDLLATVSKRQVKPAVEQARKMVNQLQKLAANKNNPKRWEQAKAAEIFNTYIDAVDNKVPEAARTVADTFGRLANLLKKMGFIKGDELTPQDVERLATMSVSWYSGIAMSGRAALAFRNLFQSALTAPKVGYSTFFRGVKKALSDEGRKEFKETGVVNDPWLYGLSDNQFDELMLQYPTGTLSTWARNAERAGRRLQRWGLHLYRKADYFNRSVAYHTGKLALEDNLSLFKNGQYEEFLFETGLIAETPGVRRAILRPLANGNLEAAAKEYGTHLVNDTQFLYSRANAPQFMKGVYGRIAGQFGVWPMAFTEYMGKNLGGLKGVVSLHKNVLKGGNISALERYQQRFATRYLGQLAALGALGAALGINVQTYNQANPLTFEGGPFMQVLRDVSLQIGGGTEIQRQLARGNLKRMAVQLWNPLGVFQHDVDEAIEAGDEGKMMKALAELLGFRVEGGLLEVAP